jgi:SAM-dependent methyltransferase
MTARPDLDTGVRDGYRWMAQLCPVCGVPPSKRLGRRGGAAHRGHLGVECEIWRCGRCELVFPNPMPVPLGGSGQHYQQSADDYFEHHSPDAKRRSALAWLQQARELTGGRGRLLDIGAGRGELLLAARQDGWAVVGIEPSTNFAAFAEHHAGIEILRCPVEECRFPDASFDVVILSAVLEHLYNPVETVREVARILRPGGAVFIDVPNERALYFRAGNLYHKLRGRDWVVNLSPTFSPFHVFGFSPRSLRALLGNHGLRPRDWRVYGGDFVVPTLNGPFAFLEPLAARAILALSRYGDLGTQIETWALKEGPSQPR